MPQVTGSATNLPGANLRHCLRRLYDPASDTDARSTVLHLNEAAVNGPSFCCSAHCIGSVESHACVPNSLFLVSCAAVNKKQPFRRKFDEKTACRPQCDALMSHKTAATSLPRRLIQ
jgi:hypothetical protein